MKRVLLVSYYFPPLGGIGSVRVASFGKELAHYGWQATVLAPRNGAYFRDDTLSFPEHQVIRTASLELSRTAKHLLRAGGTDVQPATVAGLRAAAKDFARRHVYFPDAQVGWYPPALLTSRRRIQAGDFDAIFSSSFPITAHMIARSLHRRLRSPWVAEFRDPWSASLPASSPLLSRARRLETAIGREASAVVTVSPAWSQMFESQFGRSVDVIRNGHDGETAGRPSADPEFTVGYLGSYYPTTQDLGAIWSAIGTLNGTGERPLAAIRFVGELNPQLEEELRRRGLRERVVVTGFLPHQQALDELSRSTALLVAGPPTASGTGKGVIAAKIAEYLAIDRPVIYVGDPTTDAADLVRGYPGTHIVPTGDVDAAVRALRSASTEAVRRDVGELSRHALAGRLADVLNQVAG